MWSKYPACFSLIDRKCPSYCFHFFTVRSCKKNARWINYKRNTYVCLCHAMYEQMVIVLSGIPSILIHIFFKWEHYSHKTDIMITLNSISVICRLIWMQRHITECRDVVSVCVVQVCSVLIYWLPLWERTSLVSIYFYYYGRPIFSVNNNVQACSQIYNSFFSQCLIARVDAFFFSMFDHIVNIFQQIACELDWI